MNRIVLVLVLCCSVVLCSPPEHPPSFADVYYATSADVCNRVQLPNCPSDFVGGQILSQIFYDYPNARTMALDNYNVAQTNLSSDQTYLFDSNNTLITQVYQYFAGASGWECLQTAIPGSFIPPNLQTAAVYNETMFFNRYLSYRYLLKNRVPSLEQYWFINSRNTEEYLGFESVDGAEIGYFLEYEPNADLSSPNIWAVPPNVCPEPVEYTEIDLKTKSIIARLLSKIPLNLPDEVLEFFFMN